MTYKLAKQLKDAGFPYSKDWKKDDIFNSGKMGWFDEGWFEHPILSELIEACGDDFIGIYLELNNSDNKGRYWIATACKDIKEPYKVGKEIETKGFSLEEAVSKLWLKLNIKE